MKNFKNIFIYKVTANDLLFSSGILTGLSLAFVVEWVLSHELPKALMAVCLLWSVQLIWMVLDYWNRIWKIINDYEKRN